MKRFKSIAGLCLLMMSISIQLPAQKKITGIYSSLNDYLNNQLRYHDNSANASIKLYTLAPKSYVTIRYKDSILQLNKSNIFAYRLTNGEVYRVIGNHSYQVLNNNPQLLLYKRKIPASPKEGPADQFKYYFSAANGQLQALTAWNVKQAFRDHPTLADQVDAQFKRDAELMNYDSFHQMYKLEWLLK
ncbi:MAG: hypothetical protein J7623_16075 [Chitinophaga sp.]|uniref:hypothetical protein n=1 Tax=Chitinophaga sp. TaxID=1869181 RepID=UPI001B12E90D|nr:hypothetical protein [Chitinophaga sp.]MBO9730157.1 hypothetical protein [Chitinophaga sp.]